MSERLFNGNPLFVETNADAIAQQVEHSGYAKAEAVGEERSARYARDRALAKVVLEYCNTKNPNTGKPYSVAMAERMALEDESVIAAQDAHTEAVVAMEEAAATAKALDAYVDIRRTQLVSEREALKKL